MSVWYSLEDPETGELLSLPNGESLEEGGTYVLGGTDECTLNVTYNYSKSYARTVPGYSGMVEMLDGKTAAETIPMLERAVDYLGTSSSDDYWAATDGNAGHALSILLRFAQAHPGGQWRANG